MECDFEGRTVIVVGASSGIGRAVAAKAAARKADVVMLSRSAEKLAAAAVCIEGNPLLHSLDMRDAESVDAALSRYERIDHLVLTAAAAESSRAKPIAQLSDDDLERSFDRMRGYFTVIRNVAPRLAPTGSVVMMCGAAALRPPVSGFAVLAAEGAAIPGFARALARELSPVRVNVVMAGVADTPIHDGHREEVAAWAEASLPARRFGKPGDLADAILFAMTNLYLTGSTLVVDGGLSIS